MSLKNPPKVLTSVELEGMVTDQIQLALQKIIGNVVVGHGQVDFSACRVADSPD